MNFLPILGVIFEIDSENQLPPHENLRYEFQKYEMPKYELATFERPILAPVLEVLQFGRDVFDRGASRPRPLAPLQPAFATGFSEAFYGLAFQTTTGRNHKLFQATQAG